MQYRSSMVQLPRSTGNKTTNLSLAAFSVCWIRESIVCGRLESLDHLSTGDCIHVS